jgi:hypothetical protein
MSEEQAEYITKRKGIPKRVRFEVFKRDSFTCQYCGRKSPDIILEIDHIDPVANGGDGDIMNLVTACEDCNAGKSDKQLSDNTAIEKQREQIEKLQLRREQLDMMLEWRESLLSLSDYETDRVIEFINNRIRPLSLNVNCKEIIGGYKRKWGIAVLLSAIETASGQYLKIGEGGVTQESAEKMLEKIPGICFNVAKYEKDPEAREIDSIRFGVLAHEYVNVRIFYTLCKKARNLGASVTAIKEVSADIKNWTDWKNKMENLINSMEQQNG